MGLKDLLKDKKVMPRDKDIVYDMLKDSKFTLVGLALALSECTNFRLRQLLIDQFNRCVNDHHALSDLAEKKDWYQTSTTLLHQMQIDLVDSEKTLS